MSDRYVVDLCSFSDLHYVHDKDLDMCVCRCDEFDQAEFIAKALNDMNDKGKGNE